MIENHPKSIIFKWKRNVFKSRKLKDEKINQKSSVHDKLQNFPKVLQRIESWNDFRYRYDCILRCDIVSIFQLEGSLEYQFAVLRMIPKKITFLVILWFGISDFLDLEIGEEASIDGAMRWRWDEMYCENSSNEISACRRLILLYLEATPKQPKTFREIVMNVNKMLFKIIE